MKMLILLSFLILPFKTLLANNVNIQDALRKLDRAEKLIVSAKTDLGAGGYTCSIRALSILHEGIGSTEEKAYHVAEQKCLDANKSRIVLTILGSKLSISNDLVEGTSHLR